MQDQDRLILVTMLRDLKKLLDQYQLSFYLMGGTAIGALRHHGMIPWDDDIDIGLKCSDIDQFIQAFDQSDLAQRYRLIKPMQTVGYYVPTYKLVYDTAETHHHYDAGSKLHGLFLDIFPLEKTFNNHFLRRFHQLKVRLDEVALDIKLGRGHTGNHLGLLRRYSEYLAQHKSADQLFQLYWHDITRWRSLSRHYLYYNFGSPYPIDREYYLPEEIKTVCYFNFEGDSMPLPVGYDAILTRMYGDYMTPPPDSQQVAKHLS